MASFGEIIKGIQDGKVAVLDASDVPGTLIDILGIKQMSVTVESETDQQTGDDVVMATTQEAKSLSVSINAAAANAAALAAFTGGDVTAAGVTPNRTILYEEPSAPQNQQVQITGQGSGRDATGSAFRLRVLKASIESGPTFDLNDGAWMEPNMELRGVNLAGFLFEATNYETAVAIA